MKDNNKPYVLVEKLTKDVNDLEKRVNNLGKENFKNACIRNIKIFGRFMQMIATYLVAIVLPFVGQSLLFDIPFFPDNIHQNNCYMMNLDSNGVIKYQHQYKSFDSDNSKLKIYGKWEEDKDGFYSRTISTYSINDLTVDKIKELLEKDVLTVEDIFGETSSSYKEYKNILTEEELNSNGYMEATKYYEDEDDYIIVIQDVMLNIVCSCLYIAAVLTLALGVAKFREDFSSFDYYECVEKIKEKYGKIDREELETKLLIKKNSLNRLIGDKNEK